VSWNPRDEATVEIRGKTTMTGSTTSGGVREPAKNGPAMEPAMSPYSYPFSLTRVLTSGEQEVEE